MAARCPAEIENLSIRASWHILDDAARASFLSQARATTAARGGGGGDRRGDSGGAASSDVRFPLGMQPPQGKPYEDNKEDYSADGEEDNINQSVWHFPGAYTHSPHFIGLPCTARESVVHTCQQTAALHPWNLQRVEVNGQWPHTSTSRSWLTFITT
ncbi:hypothetical protein BC628DRAFT_488105 [Trametes gibbosa]|nr:hypothetical protein BC628DRAFT_488105 [Trametes gibbosa]